MTALAHVDPDRLRRLVAEGMSDAQVADAFGVSSRTVLRWRIAFGIASEWTPELAPCGTKASYARGCRCGDCRHANTIAHRDWARRKAYTRAAVTMPP